MSTSANTSWRLTRTAAVDAGGSEAPDRPAWGAGTTVPCVGFVPGPIANDRRLFRLLDPHFELLRVGALEESSHLGGEIGIGPPRACNLLCQHEFGIVRLAKHQFHVALLLNCPVSRRITTLDESI